MGFRPPRRVESQQRFRGRHSFCVPLRRRPKGPAGGQFSPEDRADDPPVEADDLLHQATDHAAVSDDPSAADPEEDATKEAAEPANDGNEITLLREHFKRQGCTMRTGGASSSSPQR